MRHRCNNRDENLDSSHSAAPAPTNGSRAPPNFDLRHSDLGDWISPQRLGATFHIRRRVLMNKYPGTKLFQHTPMCRDKTQKLM
ncbi:hypothetical protein ABVT39_008752 [Epinephelus coioides]